MKMFGEFLCAVILCQVGTATQHSTSAPTRGGPSILVFSKGFACVHCSEEYQAYAAIAPDLKRHGVRASFVIGPEATRGDATATAVAPLTILSDPDGSMFQKYLVAGSDADHGTFVFDRNAKMIWKQTGKRPLGNAALAFAIALRSDVAAELELNDTSDPNDDYLTWSPMRARIRLARNTPGGAKMVVLTNDAEKPVPAGRTLPLDGNFVFASTVSPGQTPVASSLTLSLPADGSWVSFFVAGQFPRASTSDKDAILEVHLDKDDGPVVGSQTAMVRVRKDIDTLTPDEQTAFVKALHDLHFVKRRYEVFPHIHDLAAKGKEDYTGPVTLPNGQISPTVAAGTYWPDQAHRGSAFLPWHRAFLLRIERELQAINPAVTLPYWRQDTATRAFNTGFLGMNKDELVGAYQSEVLFSPANWLYGWSISYEDLKTVVRTPKDYILLKRPNGKTLTGDNELFNGSSPLWPEFADFHSQFEFNPHNLGHALIGAWHANCLISPSDPSFWPFHSWDDRLWAKWQWFHNRFDAEGASTSSYDYVSSFRPDDTTVTNLGHNLKDTMWPWDGTKGRVVIDKLGKGNHPPQNSFFPFPKAAVTSLWPSADAKPTPGDMIDYLGMAPHRLPLGFCYDDVPFGVRSSSGPAPAPPVNLAAADVLIDVARDNSSPFDRRVRATEALQAMFQPTAADVLDSIAADRQAPVAIRQRALGALMEARVDKGVNRLLQLADAGGKDAALAKDFVVEFAPLVHLSKIAPEKRIQFHSRLTDLADDQADPALSARAAIALARMGDRSGGKRLLDLLKSQTKPAIPRAEIAAAVPPQTTGSAPVLLDTLKKAITDNDEETAIVVLRALAGDTTSLAFRLSLIGNDMTVTPRVQRAALRSVMRDTPEALTSALAVLEGTLGSDASLKLEASGAFRVALETQSPFMPTQLATWKTRITNVQSAALATATELKQALAMTIEVIDRLSKP